MTAAEITFLNAYSFSLRSGDPALSDSEESEKTRSYTATLSTSEYHRIFSLADSHRVFPMVFEALFQSEDRSDPDSSGSMPQHNVLYQRNFEKAEKLTLSQVRTSAEFLRLYQYLGQRELYPIVMKGIICRSLYPNPEQRSSSDEDLLIPEEQFQKYHEALTAYGLKTKTPDEDLDALHEVSYYNDRVYIELHKKPFPPESKAYGDLNRYFKDVETRKVPIDIYGVPVYTMAPSDHLLYQLFHAYKHFLNCGIGIRLVSDIALFSTAYEKEIDWELIKEQCQEIHEMDFVSAIYRISEKYLLKDRFPETLRQIWRTEGVEEAPLLKDVLKGGVYGTSSEDRLHSANITLGRMETEKGGPGIPFLKTIFPNRIFMMRRYTFLREKPYLLPAAWLHRLGSYASDAILHKKKGNNASEAVRIGNERVKLMESYRMVGNEQEGFLKRLYSRTHSSFLAPLINPFYKAICAVEYAVLNAYWYLIGNRRPDRQEAALVRENVTFIVKSFERQKLVKGLCRNLSRMYPGVSVIVADDSKELLKINRPNVKVITLPFNSGLGAGLAAALEQVQTPYVFRMDDDELLTLKSNVHRELSYLMEHSELDLIGLGHTTAIRLHSPEFNFRQYYEFPMTDALLPLKVPHMTRLDENHLVLGKVANIYLARTEKLREVGYDPKIRVIDHHEFFWRAAGRIVSCVALDTVVFHRHNPYERKYLRYRSDFRDDVGYIRRKRRQMVAEHNRKSGSGKAFFD